MYRVYYMNHSIQKKFIPKKRLYTEHKNDMIGGSISTWIGVSTILIGLLGLFYIATVNSDDGSIENNNSLTLFNDFKNKNIHSQTPIKDFTIQRPYVPLGQIMLKGNFLRKSKVTNKPYELNYPITFYLSETKDNYTPSIIPPINLTDALGVLIQEPQQQVQQKSKPSPKPKPEPVPVRNPLHWSTPVPEPEPEPVPEPEPEPVRNISTIPLISDTLPLLLLRPEQQEQQEQQESPEYDILPLLLTTDSVTIGESPESDIVPLLLTTDSNTTSPDIDSTLIPLHSSASNTASSKTKLKVLLYGNGLGFGRKSPKKIISPNTPIKIIEDSEVTAGSKPLHCKESDFIPSKGDDNWYFFDNSHAIPNPPPIPSYGWIYKKIEDFSKHPDYEFDVYTYFDKNNSVQELTTHLQQTPYDICIAASKGVPELIDAVNGSKINTSLLLISSIGTIQGKQISKDANVNKIIFTYGGKDTLIDSSITPETEIKNCVQSNNSVQVYLYSNSEDGHNPRSLILPHTESTTDCSDLNRIQTNFTVDNIEYTDSDYLSLLILFLSGNTLLDPALYEETMKQMNITSGSNPIIFREITN
jgi:outer membrane biosynthesis protein TonB